MIRTDTLDEMFDVAALLSTQPLPRGDRVAIVTNAGGPGILCADACQAAGVQVPEPSPGWHPGWPRVFRRPRRWPTRST